MGFCMYSMYQLATVVFWFTWSIFNLAGFPTVSTPETLHPVVIFLVAFVRRPSRSNWNGPNTVCVIGFGGRQYNICSQVYTGYIGLTASCSIVQYWPRPTQQWWMGITTVVPKDRSGALIFMDHINGLTHRSNGILFKKPRPQLPLSIQHDLMILTIQFK